MKGRATLASRSSPDWAACPSLVVLNFPFAVGPCRYLSSDSAGSGLYSVADYFSPVVATDQFGSAGLYSVVVAPAVVAAAFVAADLCPTCSFSGPAAV